MNSMHQLDELEQDLLNEIFNLGVGNAAGSLSQMVKQEITLSVPEVNFVTIKEITEILGENNILASVSQSLKGPFSAQSMIIFPDKDGFEVVRCMLGDNFSDESIAELQSEAMSEIGNVVLNACIGSLSEALSTVFYVDLPEFDRTTPLDLFHNRKIKDEELILFIRIELSLSESKVSGYLAFLMGVESFIVLKGILKDTIESLI